MLKWDSLIHTYESKSFAIVGIGDVDGYLKNYSHDELVTIWDPYYFKSKTSKVSLFDIDPYTVLKTKDLGFDAVIVDLTTDSLPVSFDYIIASDVIEHVSNPISFLKNLKKSLKEGGEIILTTPNANYWRNFVYGGYKEYEDHNFSFTDRHFQNLCNKVGLKIKDLKTIQLYSNKKRIKDYFLLPFHSLFSKIGRGSTILVRLQA